MDTSKSRAVSPVVGVILVVAITVALSGVVGVFVFDLGQSVSDSSTGGDIATRTTYNDDGTASIQVITGTADELRVLVNGTEANSTTNPRPGDSLIVTANPDSSVTVISEIDGQSTVVSSASQTDSTIPTAGLVAHYKLNGDTIDSAGIYNGTSHGGLTYDSAKQAEGAAFDGDDDHVDIPSGVISQENFTVTVWFNSSSHSSDSRLVSLRGDTNLIINIGRSGTDTVGYWWGGTDYTVKQVATETWYLLTIVYDDETDTTTAYLNDDAEKIQSLTWADGNGQSSIGGKYDGTYLYNGVLDDVRVYNRTLSESEVGNLYNATK